MFIGFSNLWSQREDNFILFLISNDLQSSTLHLKLSLSQPCHPKKKSDQHILTEEVTLEGRREGSPVGSWPSLANSTPLKNPPICELPTWHTRNPWVCLRDMITAQHQFRFTKLSWCFRQRWKNVQIFS